MIDLAMLKASASCLRLAIDVAAQLSGPSQSPEAWSDVIADQLQHLGSLIRDRSDKILSNLENAKMQELTSRINIIAILIKSGDTDHIMPSVISLCEALDYAKMRLFEGNMEWFFPFYVGHTVAVTALRCLDKSDGAFESSLRSSFKQGRSAVCLALENIARQNIKKPAVFGKLFDNFKAGDDLALVSLLENLENIRGRLTGARERWQQSLDMDGCGLGLFFHADNPSLFFTYEGFPDYYEFQNCRMFNSDKFEKIKNIEFTEDYEGKTNLPDK
jgi:hypothetical protein